MHLKLTQHCKSTVLQYKIKIKLKKEKGTALGEHTWKNKKNAEWEMRASCTNIVLNYLHRSQRLAEAISDVSSMQSSNESLPSLLDLPELLGANLSTCLTIYRKGIYQEQPCEWGQDKQNET